MADVDTSTYPKLKNNNPLEMVSGFANLQNTLNQNKLFQQQFQTNKAVSNIYKQAINPDGTIDQEKLTSLLASDPNASYGLPQAYQGSQEATKRNIDIDIAKVNQAMTHLTATAGYLAPLIKPGSTSNDVASALAHASANGLINPENAGKIWSSLPRGQNGQIDESRIPMWAQQQQLQVMDAQQRLQAMHPAPTQIDTGSNIQLMNLPQVGQPSLAGTIQKGLPPTTPVFPAGGGQPIYAGSSGGGGMPGAGGGGGQGGGVAAANPPGFEGAANTAGAFSANQGNTLQGRADRTMDNKAILGNLESELGTAGFTTGPGTESVAKFAKFVNAQTGSNFRAEGLAAREQFNKLAGMLAQSQFQALGGTGTDAKLDATTLTSPNSELSKMGNKGIIALLKGNEDAISAKNQAWQQWQQQHGPQSYGQFQTQFNKSYDPRVFQTQYLDYADRKKMLTGLTQQEKNQLHGAFVTARQNGWIK